MRKLWSSSKVLWLLGITGGLFFLGQMSLIRKLMTTQESTSKSPEVSSYYAKRKAPSRRKKQLLPKTSCVQVDCIQQKAVSLARAFPDRSNRTWQGGDEQIEISFPSLHQGLLYSRIPKTGSSTITAAAFRISHKVSVSSLKGINHILPSEADFGNRDRTKSFLFASVRDPGERAMSYISYDNSRESPFLPVLTEAELLRSLHTFDTYGGVCKSEGRGGSQLAYASLHFIPKFSAWKRSLPTQVLNPKRVEDNVHHIVDRYDFLLVTERMDESLVAMALILGISVDDVLVFNSKVGDSHYLPVHRNKENGGMVLECVPLHRNPFSKSPSVQEYLNSDEWRAMNYGDYLLHQVAWKSLDLTIQALGEHRFQQALVKYRDLMALATQRCVPSNQIHRPCSSDGQLQIEKASKNCYHADAGCGYQCIDDMLAEMNI